MMRLAPGTDGSHYVNHTLTSVVMVFVAVRPTVTYYHYLYHALTFLTVSVSIVRLLCICVEEL